MARDQNFLLGLGEKLAAPVKIDKASGPKNPPYTFARAKERIGARLGKLREKAAALPELACPRDEVVAVLTMHPRYLSKSDFPQELLASVGVRSVGSRAKDVAPESWGVGKHPDSALSEDIFVAGTRSAFQRWEGLLPSWEEKTFGAKALPAIEDLTLFDETEKLKGIPQEVDELLLEVVLHNANSDAVVSAFVTYAELLGGNPQVKARKNVEGLTFIPLYLPRNKLIELAKFSFVRVVRGMPTLRPLRPTLLRSVQGYDVVLPTATALDTQSKAVIFDGGIPKAAQDALKTWVNFIDAPGTGLPSPALEQHGLAVTTAFLFGHMQQGETLTAPMCSVDHVRVMDAHTGAGNDIHYYDVLDRITKHLDDNLNAYKFINISLGPNMAVDDDDVTLWTSSLDRRFSHGRCVTTVAVGNDGHLDAASGLNRVQPPADGVNVLSVGSADTTGQSWAVADYSCRGPGRSPGIVKPDGVTFGGSDKEGFGVLLPSLKGGSESGTSLAAPMTLRSCASIGAQLGTALNPLAMRALMIHRAEASGQHAMRDVGWGRFETDPRTLVTCDDNEALVVYQGNLPVGEHLRATVPLPDGILPGLVEITATLIVAPDIDPQHPSAYTRSGLEVAFRPHHTRYQIVKKTGKPGKHAKTKPFFSEKLLYGKSEYILRQDGHKWEPCLKNKLTLKGEDLLKPVFDIYYHHREGAGKAADPQPIPYAFILSVRAHEIADYYNQVVRAYPNILLPIKPQVQLQIRPGRPPGA